MDDESSPREYEPPSQKDILKRIDKAKFLEKQDSPQKGNNRLVIAQIHQEQRLENEITKLRESLEEHKKWSRILAIVTGILSLILLGVAAAQLWVML